MREDQTDTQDAGAVQESPQDYVAPALTDLGSFEDLTQLGSGDVQDSEGAS
jgi:hypothetical protein